MKKNKNALNCLRRWLILCANVDDATGDKWIILTAPPDSRHRYARHELPSSTQRTTTSEAVNLLISKIQIIKRKISIYQLIELSLLGEPSAAEVAAVASNSSNMLTSSGFAMDQPMCIKLQFPSLIYFQDDAAISVLCGNFGRGLGNRPPGPNPNLRGRDLIIKWWGDLNNVMIMWRRS